jgi:hypothetical protein
LEEANLGGLYQILIVGDKLSRFWHSLQIESNVCTFDEFWKAFNVGKVVELMDAKGLRDLRMRMAPCHFDIFMSACPGQSRISVWRLKWFLVDDRMVDPEKPVVADYGFYNCKTLIEKYDLKNVYKKVLENADPLELHKACIQGTLFEFVT